MRSTKIFTVMEGYSKRDIKSFMKFLQSPYFNNSESMVVLAELIVDLIKTGSDMEKEEVWRVLGEERDFDDARFRKYCSDLLKLSERYLAQQEFDDNPLRSAAYLLNRVATSGIEPLYNSSLRTARRLTNNQQARGIDFLHDLYLIERYHQVILTAKSRTQKLNVEAISNNLDKFYIAQKLMLYQLSMSQKRIVDLEYDLLFLDEIFNHIEKHPYSDTPQIRILELVARIYQSNNTELFSELKQLLFDHVDLFPPAEANSICRSALNFLIGWSNEGKSEYLRELFELYKYVLKQEFFFQEEGFNPWIFKTIVLVALRLEEFDWCAYFIDNYADRLDSEHRENAIIFNRARLFWYQKNHKRVLSLLSQVEFEDFSYNLSSKAMLLATYYELDEVEALFSFLDSFTIFLRRNTANIPEKRRENYLNLIFYTRKLSKLGFRDPEKLNALKIEIENKENLGDKRWLLEKINEKLN